MSWLGQLSAYGKKDLVSTLGKFFERTADPDAALGEHERPYLASRLDAIPCPTVGD
jgi:hypothetical protein